VLLEGLERLELPVFKAMLDLWVPEEQLVPVAVLAVQVSLVFKEQAVNQEILASAVS